MNQRLTLLLSGLIFFQWIPLASQTTERPDGAQRLKIKLAGSQQNPAWSPDGQWILFTLFKKGYNHGPADLYLYHTLSHRLRLLVTGGDNTNRSGPCWSARTGTILFASGRPPHHHEEVYAIPFHGRPGDEYRLTRRPGWAAYFPVFSPDGDLALFEGRQFVCHNNGVVTTVRLEGRPRYLTKSWPEDDSRRPTFSPGGTRIAYQRWVDEQWEIWVMDPSGSRKWQVTRGPGQKTAPCFDPTGDWIIYSHADQLGGVAALQVAPVSGESSRRISDFEGYNGSPCWSPEGLRVAFESAPEPQDQVRQTELFLLHLRR